MQRAHEALRTDLVPSANQPRAIEEPVTAFGRGPSKQTLMGVKLPDANLMCYTLRMGNTLTIRLTDEEAQWLRKAAKQSGKTRSAILHDQLRLARAPQKFRHLVGAIEGGARDVSERKGFAKR